MLESWFWVLLWTLAEILVSKLAELNIVQMHNYAFKSITFQSEFLAKSAQIHIDPALDLHIKEVFLPEDWFFL